MSYKQPNALKFYTVSRVDATHPGETLLTVTESSSRFSPLFLNIECQSAREIVKGCRISIGTNQHGYDNILPDTELLGIVNENVTLTLSPIEKVESIPANSSVYLKINDKAIAENYTLRATLIGFYF